MTRHNSRSDLLLHVRKLELTTQALVVRLSTLARFHQPVWGSCVSRRHWLMRRALPTTPLILIALLQRSWRETGQKVHFNFYITLLSLTHHFFLNTHSTYFKINGFPESCSTYLIVTRKAFVLSNTVIRHGREQTQSTHFVLIWNLRLCRRTIVRAFQNSTTNISRNLQKH